MKKGEDIEHYADEYEERQKVLREIHESSDEEERSEEEVRKSN